MAKNSKILQPILRILLNMFYYFSILLFIYVFLSIFVFSSFKVPTESMEPTIISGDYILVNKSIYGARLFDLFDAAQGKTVNIRRVPGLGKIRNNDVVVFHMPYPKSWEKMEMSLKRFLVKRCIGISGDTVKIENGIYVINNEKEKHRGNYNDQLSLSKMSKETLSNGILKTFPWDSLLNWDVKDFGPLYVPKKGDKIDLNRINALLYKKIIQWELGHSLKIENDILRDGEKALSAFTFSHNYYFMAGDKVMNSQDSRYLGLIPDDFIVGKAWVIWKSIDPYSTKTRWNRIFKRIN